MFGLTTDQKEGANWWSNGRRRFVLFCTYYVLATYLIPSTGTIHQYSMAYFALVLPGWLYIASSWRVLLQPCCFLARLWWLFIVTAIGVAIVQSNVSLAYNGIFLGLLAIVIINSGGYLRTAELNGLFLVTVVGSILIYLLGLTDYGFLPGQASTPGCHEALYFRVSLFRVPSESAALSLYVILWNIFLPPGGPRWLRWLFILLALYFLVLSGIRTVMLALVMVSPLLLYHLLNGFRTLSRVALSLLIPVSLILLFTQQLSRPPGESWIGKFLSSYVLRIDTCDALIYKKDKAITPIERNSTSSNEYIQGIMVDRGLTANWLEQTFNRHCSAKYQFNQFLKQPLAGNPVTHPTTEADLVLAGCDTSTMQNYCDACVLGTYWLNKGGLAGILFIALFLATLLMAIRRYSLMGVVALTAFGLVMQGWGVMFIPYNFNFYMLISLIPLIGISDSYRRKNDGNRMEAFASNIKSVFRFTNNH